jgi:hypothetical protein
MQTVKSDSKAEYFKRIIQVVAQIDMETEPWMIRFRPNSAIELLEQLSASVDLTPKSDENLKLAPANQACKDQILSQMRVVPVPIAAAILGISQHELYRFHESTCGRYGGEYLRALSFSIAELKIMAENPKWFGKDFRPCYPDLLESLAYQGTFVSEGIAEAYLGKMPFLITCGRGCRPFRISDIRAYITRSAVVWPVA